jgi:cell wall-associated NlpC family hydrolase
MGSPVLLQQYKNKKWVTKKTIETKNTAAAQSINVVYPNVWWKKNKTYWRYVVKAGAKNTKATYGLVTLKTKKYYQNPKRYVQIKNKISKHGHNYYTAPVLTNNMSTRKQHVEAMIKTAKKYLGDPYIDCRSQAPGKGVDCSGLVMQACYGAGVDLWPSNPWRHRFPKFEYESRRIAKMKTLKTVSWKNRRRGDLLFYSRGGRVMHVAIYLGHGKIIHSSYPNVRISRARSATWGRITRVARVFN